MAPEVSKERRGARVRIDLFSLAARKRIAGCYSAGREYKGRAGPLLTGKGAL